MKAVYLAAFVIISALALAGTTLSEDSDAITSDVWGGITWELDTTTSTLTFSGEGEIHGVNNDYKAPWGYDYENVVFEEGITSIGYLLLCESSVRTVTFADSITSIGNGVFSGCNDLTSITIPANITEFGTGLFGSCENLSSVTIEAPLSTIPERMFSGCPSLTEADLNGPITGIGEGAFNRCTSLSDWDFSNITEIGNNAFNGCTSLNGVNAPDAVTIGDGAFAGCSSLTEALIPNAIEIGDAAFINCPSLGTIRLDSAETIGDHAFASNEIITELSLPNAVSIGDWAFALFIELRTLTMGDGVETIGSSAFTESDISELHIGPNLRSIGDTAFQNCRYLKTIELEGDGFTIGHRAFFDCTEVEEITLQGTPSSVESESFLLAMPYEEANAIVKTQSPGILDAGINEYTHLTYIGLDEYRLSFSVSHGPSGFAPSPVYVTAGETYDLSSLERDGYSLTVIYDGAVVDGDGFVMPSENTTLSLSYLEEGHDETYTVSFTVDGTVFQTSQLRYGSLVVPPTDEPQKQSDEDYDYVFAGWRGYTEGTLVTGDMTFEAVFEAVPKHFDYTMDGTTMVISIGTGAFRLTASMTEDIAGMISSGEVSGIRFENGDAAIILSGNAFTRLSADGISVSIDSLDSNDLPSSLIEPLDGRQVYSFSINGSTDYSDYSIGVILPVPAGTSYPEIRTYSEDGSSRTISSTVENGEITGYIHDLAYVAVFEGESGTMPLMLILAGVIVLIAVVVVALFVMRRRRRTAGN